MRGKHPTTDQWTRDDTGRDRVVADSMTKRLKPTMLRYFAWKRFVHLLVETSLYFAKTRVRINLVCAINRVSSPFHDARPGGRVISWMITQGRGEIANRQGRKLPLHDKLCVINALLGL